MSQDQTLFVLKETERDLPTEEKDGQGGIMYTLNSVEVHSLAYEEKDGVLVLNDQGGGVMSVSYDVAGTLRAQDHGHPPLIFDARGNGGVLSPPRSRATTRTESRTTQR